MEAAMSLAKVAMARRHARLCACGRKALSAVHGTGWCWRPDHPLCAQCKRSLDASLKVHRLRAVRSSVPSSVAALGIEGLEVMAGLLDPRNDDRER
jgi:hypothetical protein